MVEKKNKNQKKIEILGPWHKTCQFGTSLGLWIKPNLDTRKNKKEAQLASFKLLSDPAQILGIRNQQEP
jgi:hypothetical protein